MKKLLSLLFLFGILFAFTVKVHADGTYLVIDLETWQYRYTDTAPNLADDTCRTTELWLRYIPEGEFMMGPPADELGCYKEEVRHKVTLTKPFYIGVFECTQAQWEYVMGEGNRPSYFNNDDYYATRPVEKVSYDMIRGSKENGVDWRIFLHGDPAGKDGADGRFADGGPVGIRLPRGHEDGPELGQESGR